MPFDQQDFGLPSGRSVEGRASPATDPAAMDEVLRLLVYGRSLIEDPKNWHQGNGFAHDAKGRDVWEETDEAVCFCSGGAIRHAGYKLGIAPSKARQYLKDTAGHPYYHHVMLNQSGTHADVLANWGRAIALAEADAAGIARPSTERPEGTPPLSSLSK